METVTAYDFLINSTDLSNVLSRFGINISDYEPRRGPSPKSNGVSVSVSTFNLVAISIERYYAICSPLASMAWQTRSHAKKVITATWVVSSILMLPYPISSTLIPFTRLDNSTGHMCRLVWPNAVFQQSWYIALLLVLFLIPGIMMATAYGRICVKLYKGIRRAQSLKSSSSERHSSTGSVKPANGNGCNSSESKRTRRSKSGELPETSRNSRQNELVANKRVIHMLIIIVVLFFLCWTPIYVVNAWKAFDKTSANRLTGAPISFIHLLSYTSSCVNPIVYCFMNKRFRRAILANYKISWRIRKWFYYGKTKRPSVLHNDVERRFTLSSGMNVYSQSMRESTPCVNTNIPMTQCSKVP
ncbi:cholecystokinin receptor type A isoform X2 [Poecilia reticulata]|uniref:cholecystokinin receptor type A isoform X2 n=1 Tax=Poecilia reticulata TaxID=8081 RepID=UPI0004A3D006|nr:PREDICTED: cholecystokinin receptor type A isoform X2 [Poecilia reticulata]